MERNFPSKATYEGLCAAETPTPLSWVMALLDIAGEEVDKDCYVAKASIVRAAALLREHIERI